VRWFRPGRLLLVLLLLPLLAFVLGFKPGADMNSEEARQAAVSVPKLEEPLSHPTVETSANYEPASDSWRVFLREDASGTAVAKLTVDDDTREVSEVEVYPVSETLTYPETSESEAIKLALADPEVREELDRHGPYTSDAEYEDDEWTVHFEVDESGLVGGYPVDDGDRKEVARVGVNDETWELNYVWTGDQVGWRMARGD
jgi:hypothetical protein